MKSLLIAFSILFLMGCDQQATGADLSITTQDGKRYDFEVEMAMTPAQMQKGLMMRTELAENRGMFFWFGNEEERGFWMKNTLIPLDIIFIKANGTILSIKTGKPEDTATLFSEGPAAAVFEINGGLAGKYGIKPGDTVHFTFFGNELAE
jgi:hypothetical protein